MRGRHAGVVGRDRLLREDFGEPDRLAAEIGLRPAEDVALEERSATTAAISPLTTMPSRKSAGNRKRSELNIMTYKVPLGLTAVRRGPDLVADAHTVTIGEASPSLRRSWRTWTSTVRVSPAKV